MQHVSYSPHISMQAPCWMIHKAVSASDSRTGPGSQTKENTYIQRHTIKHTIGLVSSPARSECFNLSRSHSMKEWEVDNIIASKITTETCPTKWNYLFDNNIAPCFFGESQGFQQRPKIDSIHKPKKQPSIAIAWVSGQQKPHLALCLAKLATTRKSRSYCNIWLSAYSSHSLFCSLHSFAEQAMRVRIKHPKCYPQLVLYKSHAERFVSKGKVVGTLVNSKSATGPIGCGLAFLGGHRSSYDPEASNCWWVTSSKLIDS